MVPPSPAPKTIESTTPSAWRCGATASAWYGAPVSVSATTLFGSATTMPAAIRYLASIGWVHS